MTEPSRIEQPPDDRSRREILNMAMEKQIELLNQKVAALSRENKELKEKERKVTEGITETGFEFY